MVHIDRKGGATQPSAEYLLPQKIGSLADQYSPQISWGMRGQENSTQWSYSLNKISSPSIATRILAGLSSAAIALTLAVVVTPLLVVPAIPRKLNHRSRAADSYMTNGTQ